MAAVRREVVFEAPGEEVWRALTQPERLREWFANDVELDVRPGGAGVVPLGRRLGATCRRWSAVDEERRFAFRWSDEDGARDHVELVLEDAPEGTRLTVTRAAAGRPPGERARGRVELGRRVAGRAAAPAPARLALRRRADAARPRLRRARRPEPPAPARLPRRARDGDRDGARRRAARDAAGGREAPRRR